MNGSKAQRELGFFLSYQFMTSVGSWLVLCVALSYGFFWVVFELVACNADRFPPVPTSFLPLFLSVSSTDTVNSNFLEFQGRIKYVAHFTILLT